MASQEGHQEHDLTVYWIMWIALFVLSAGSYATDFMDRGIVRHTLIIFFMLVKAGGIVAVCNTLGEGAIISLPNQGIV